MEEAASVITDITDAHNSNTHDSTHDTHEHDDDDDMDSSGNACKRPRVETKGKTHKEQNLTTLLRKRLAINWPAIRDRIASHPSEVTNPLLKKLLTKVSPPNDIIEAMSQRLRVCRKTITTAIFLPTLTREAKRLLVFQSELSRETAWMTISTCLAQKLTDRTITVPQVKLLFFAFPEIIRTHALMERLITCTRQAIYKRRPQGQGIAEQIVTVDEIIVPILTFLLDEHPKTGSNPQIVASAHQRLLLGCAFHQAVYTGNLVVVKVILKHVPSIVTVRAPGKCFRGFLPIQIAAHRLLQYEMVEVSRKAHSVFRAILKHSLVLNYCGTYAGLLEVMPKIPFSKFVLGILNNAIGQETIVTKAIRAMDDKFMGYSEFDCTKGLKNIMVACKKEGVAIHLVHIALRVDNIRNPKTLDKLVRIFPECLTMRLDGFLPLHYALHHGYGRNRHFVTLGKYETLLDWVCAANARATAEHCPVTNLLPFMMAAHGGRERKSDLTSTFKLLQCNPGVMLNLLYQGETFVAAGREAKDGNLTYDSCFHSVVEDEKEGGATGEVVDEENKYGGVVL